MFLSMSTYVLFVCVRICVCLRISVYSIIRSLYLMFFIPHVLQRKFRCGLCTLGKNFFLYKLFKFFAILTRYQHCALLLSYQKLGFEPRYAAFKTNCFSIAIERFCAIRCVRRVVICISNSACNYVFVCVFVNHCL